MSLVDLTKGTLHCTVRCKVHCCIYFKCKGTLSGTFKYLGCYQDIPTTRDLNGQDVSMQSMTVDMCTAQCQQSGFPYAGLQMGTRCFCGKVYGSIGQSTGLIVVVW